MPKRPTLLHRMALVSFLLFRKNLGNLREFLGQMFSAPGKKLPMIRDQQRTYILNLEKQIMANIL